MPVIGVLGAGGFLGRHVVRAISDRGGDVVCLPRFETEHSFVNSLGEVSVVINAAGAASPNAKWGTDLDANSELPAALLRACESAGVDRMVHISSSAVQGYQDEWDELLEFAPFSAYSFSKAMGEVKLMAARPENVGVSIFRATSVLNPSKVGSSGASARLGRLLSPVAEDAPLPFSTPETTAESVAALALHPDASGIFLQPWEGATTTWFWKTQGMSGPIKVPRQATGLAAKGLQTIDRPGTGRSIRLLTCGQRLSASRSEAIGLVPDREQAFERIASLLGTKS